MSFKKHGFQVFTCSKKKISCLVMCPSHSQRELLRVVTKYVHTCAFYYILSTKGAFLCAISCLSCYTTYMCVLNVDISMLIRDSMERGGNLVGSWRHEDNSSYISMRKRHVRGEREFSCILWCVCVCRMFWISWLSLHAMSFHFSARLIVFDTRLGFSSMKILFSVVHCAYIIYW